MVKVIVADDEERICQLIEALVDWEALGLELLGFAHNGLEAGEMVEKLGPDILITDIRMPGCSGLDLIRRVKESSRAPEIIVISGYAHFEYAQQAIKYGVGDYLLKPISKTELSATLEKLKGRICDRRESEQDKEELLRKARKDVRRLRTNLIGDLMEQETLPLSMEILKEHYYLEVQPGLFQVFWMKMDGKQDTLKEPSASVLMEKAQEVLERNLKEVCVELVTAIKGYACIGIINYPGDRREEIRRRLKECLNQLELQKNLFSPVTFSISVGSAFDDPGLLPASMKDASVLIQDRIVKGMGRLLERMGTASRILENNVLEKYLRDIDRALEELDAEQSDAVVDSLLKKVQELKEMRGYEIFELVYSAADLFSARAQMPDRTGCLEEFRKQCDQCSSKEELFQCLSSFQKQYIEECRIQNQNEAVRPIRKAKQYIQNHYSDPITLEEVSSAVGLSTAYFSVLFKKTEGEGFAKYLINVRMEQAKILLRESNISVAEICRKVGYNDLKHFTHTFEKAVGVKPATYRKLYG
ncbi:MAG: response regulator [Lachnospiraceae bacterium]|nr:response regulator [Lachnospiraceae bacterium]